MILNCTGGYRDALRFRPGEPITFDPDAFVVSRPADMQSLLRTILQLQTFQQFVSDRLDLLNAGEGFKDEFDIEASLYSDKWGTQSRYKDWLSHMKVCFTCQVVSKLLGVVIVSCFGSVILCSVFIISMS